MDDPKKKKQQQQPPAKTGGFDFAAESRKNMEEVGTAPAKPATSTAPATAPAKGGGFDFAAESRKNMEEVSAPVPAKKKDDGSGASQSGSSSSSQTSNAPEVVAQPLGETPWLFRHEQPSNFKPVEIPDPVVPQKIRLDNHTFLDRDLNREHSVTFRDPKVSGYDKFLGGERQVKDIFGNVTTPAQQFEQDKNFRIRQIKADPKKLFAYNAKRQADIQDQAKKISDKMMKSINSSWTDEKTGSETDMMNEISGLQDYQAQLRQSVVESAFPTQESAKNYLHSELVAKGAPVKSFSDDMLGPKPIDPSADLDKYQIGSIANNIDPSDEASTAAFYVYQKHRVLEDILKSTPDLQAAALKYTASQNPDINQQLSEYTKAGTGDPVRDYPNAAAGKIVADFLSDEAIVKRASDDPEFAKKYYQAKGNLYINFPDYARKNVAEKIGQERQDRGMNSLWYNNPSAETTDALVDEMVKNGKTLSGQPFDESDRLAYKRMIRPQLAKSAFARSMSSQAIPTPDLVNSFSEGINEGVSGIVKTLATPTPGFKLLGDQLGITNPNYNVERRKRSINEEAALATINPASLTDEQSIAQGLGHFTGFMIPMIASGAAIKGVGIAGTGAEYLNNFLMFAGNNYDNAIKMYGNDSRKVMASAVLGTGFDVAAGRLLPASKAEAGLKKIFTRQVGKTLDDLTAEAITQPEARKRLMDIGGKYLLKPAISLVKNNTEAAAVMSGFGLYHNAVDGILGGKKDVSLYSAIHDAVNDFKTNWLSATVVSGIGVAGEMKNKRLKGKVLSSIADNADHYRQIINERAATDPALEATKNERINNLNHAEIIWNAINDADRNRPADQKFTPEQKEKYLVTGLQQKMWEERANKTQDDTVKADYLKRAEEAKKAKEAIYNGEDKAEDHKAINNLDKEDDGFGYHDKIANAKTEAEKEAVDKEYSDFLSKQDTQHKDSVSSLADKIQAGEKNFSDEEVQFYQNNKVAVENELTTRHNDQLRAKAEARDKAAQQNQPATEPVQATAPVEQAAPVEATTETVTPQAEPIPPVEAPRPAVAEKPKPVAVKSAKEINENDIVDWRGKPFRVEAKRGNVFDIRGISDPQHTVKGAEITDEEFGGKYETTKNTDKGTESNVTDTPAKTGEQQVQQPDVPSSTKETEAATTTTTGEPAGGTTAADEPAKPEPVKRDVTSSVYEKPEGENPIHKVTINGRDHFIQRVDQLNSGYSWLEVKKNEKGHWVTADGQPWVTSRTLGYTKVEAINDLIDLHHDGKVGTTTETTTPNAEKQTPTAAEAPKPTPETQAKANEVTTDAQALASLTPEEKAQHLGHIINGDLPAAQAILDSKKTTTAKSTGRVIRKQNLSDIDKEIKSTSDTKRKAVLETVRKVANALTKVMPDAQMVIHDTNASFQRAYEAAGGKGSARGYFDDNKTIHINLQYANDVTAFHEGSHQLQAFAFRNAPEVTKKFYDQLQSILPDVHRKNLDSFVENNYRGADDVTKRDEFVTEFFGRVASGSIDLKEVPQTTLDRIKNAIRRVAESLGLDPKYIGLDTRDDVIAFANRITEAFNEDKVFKIKADIKADKTLSDNVRAQANAILKGELKLEDLIGKTKGRVLNRDVAEGLYKFYKDRFKIFRNNEWGPKAVDTISDYATDEAVLAMSEYGDKSGRGWYTDDYEKAINILSEKIPELKTNPDAREAATLMIAVSSNSTDVETNLRNLTDKGSIDHFLKTKRLPTDIGSGVGSDAIRQGLEKINEIIEAYDGDIHAVKDLLLKPMTIRDSEAMAKEFGIKIDTGWDKDMVMPASISILGPKIGAFYANLSGEGGLPTVDRWAIRTISRYRGDMRTEAPVKDIKAYADRVGLTGATKPKIMEAAKKDWNKFQQALYKRGEYKDQTRAQRNAAMSEARKGWLLVQAEKGIVDVIPGGKADQRRFRTFTFDVMKEAQRKIKERTGEDLSVSDVQAVLWLYEKKLFDTLGVSQEAVTNYSHAAEKIVNERNQEPAPRLRAQAIGEPVEYKIGVTNAAEKDVDEMIGTRLDHARELEKAGRYDEANGIYKDIVRPAERRLKDVFRDLPEITVETKPTKGNFFNTTEPTIETTIRDEDSHQNEIIARMADLGEQWKQWAVHVSELSPDLPEGSQFGEPLPDKSVYEPNLEIKFDKKLTEDDIKAMNETIQGTGLAGSTLHSDQQGLTLYNLSAFKPYGQFISETGELLTALHERGVRFQVERNARKLWNIGTDPTTSTISYEEAKGLSGSNPTTEPAAAQRGGSREADNTGTKEPQLTPQHLQEASPVRAQANAADNSGGKASFEDRRARLEDLLANGHISEKEYQDGINSIKKLEQAGYGPHGAKKTALADIEAERLRQERLKQGKISPEANTGDSSQSTGEKTSSVKNASTAEKRAEFGLPPAEKVKRMSDAEIDAAATKALKAGYDVKGEIINDVLDNGSRISDVETAILRKYMATKETDLRSNNQDLERRAQNGEDVADLLKKRDQLQDDLLQAYTASKKTGSETAKAFRQRQVERNSLADRIAEEMTVRQTTKISKEQMAEIVKEYEKEKDVTEKLRKKVTNLQAQVRRAQAEKNIDKVKTVARTGSRTKEQFATERKSIADKIKEKLAKIRGGFAAKQDTGPKSQAMDSGARAQEFENTNEPANLDDQLKAIAGDVNEYVRSLVDQNTSIPYNDIVNSVRDLLKPDMPEIGDYHIHGLLAGEYNPQREAKSDIARKMEDIRIQSKLITKLEDLKNGYDKASTQEKVRRDVEIERLRKEVFSRSRESRKGKTEEQVLDNMKKRYKEQIATLKDKLDKGDYSIEPKREPVIKDAEALKLQDELINLKIERQKRLNEIQLAQKKTWGINGKAVDMLTEALNAPRTLMASMDFSAPMRQGLVAGMAHPITAAKAFGNMFKFAFNEKHYNRWLDDLYNSDVYPIMKESDLYIADQNKLQLNQKEERFMSNFVERIPVVGSWLVRGSERAYTGYLNKLRADIFMDMTTAFMRDGKTIENNPQLYKGLASFINASTGRGSLKIGNYEGLENASQLLATGFFSPRLAASRISLIADTLTLGQRGYKKVPLEIRKMKMRDLLAFYGGTSALTALLYFASKSIFKDDDVTMEYDPRSTDFGKVRVGDTRFDVWGGFQQYYRFIAQYASGQVKSTTTGQIRDLDPKKFPFQSRNDVAFNFVNSKVSPTIGLFEEIGRGGYDSFGNKVTPLQMVGSHLVPLLAQDIYEAEKDSHDVKRALLVGAASMFGVGTNTQIPKDKQ